MTMTPQVPIGGHLAHSKQGRLRGTHKQHDLYLDKTIRSFWLPLHCQFRRRTLPSRCGRIIRIIISDRRIGVLLVFVSLQYVGLCSFLVLRLRGDPIQNLGRQPFHRPPGPSRLKIENRRAITMNLFKFRFLPCGWLVVFLLVFTACEK